MEDGFARPTVEIISEPVTYKNRTGKNIIGFHDHPKNSVLRYPFIVIPPGYGETKRDSLIIAYYLAKNGFDVIRYDNTDHIGESEGEIFYTTLPKAKDDLIASIDFVQSKFSIDKVGVVASSLAKRVSIKAATEDRRIRFLLGIVGIVDLQATLKTIYCDDIIGTFLNALGEGKDLDKVFLRGRDEEDAIEILGSLVHREFPKSAIYEKYHNLDSTIEDIKKLDIPIVFITAEKDAWTKTEDIMKVFEAIDSKDKNLYIIPGSMHQIHENPRAAKAVLKQTVVNCLQHLAGIKIRLDDVLEPTIREIGIQNRIEKKRLKQIKPITKESERNFWNKYLGKYIIITRSQDFRDLLSLIDILLGPQEENEIILDAGCGNGHYGAWLLGRVIDKVRIHKHYLQYLPKRNYIGLDFVVEAIREAEKRHKDIQLRFIEKEGLNKSIELLNCCYVLADLDEPIPFRNNYFDKICCNLVISYINKPIFALKELFRVLKPGKKIVVTSLKPYADLSLIYRNFVTQAETEEDIEEARRLLGSAGKIKEKESEGYYQFFSKGYLKSLLAKMGAKEIQIYRSFGEQVNVAVAQK